MSVLGLFSKFNHNKLSNGLEIDFYLCNFTNQTKNVLTVKFSNEALAVVPQSPLRVTLRGNKYFTISIESLHLDSGISVYPNPTTGIITFKSLEDMQLIQLHDLQGKLILEVSANGKTDSFDISHFSTGIYIAKILCNSTIYTFKIQKL
jgi:hypothetical protein